MEQAHIHSEEEYTQLVKNIKSFFGSMPFSADEVGIDLEMLADMLEDVKKFIASDPRFLLH